jgi:hypothetical protein
MAKKVTRRGRPSREHLKERAYRSRPLTAQPEGIQFRLLRPTDDRADVEHYWARGAFYEALRLYAPSAYRELTETEYSSEPDSPTRFSQFLVHLEATLARWCSKHAFLVVGTNQPEDDRVPGWLSPDMIDSFMDWYPKQGLFPLRAFWRDRWEPVKDNVYYPEPDPMEDLPPYREPVIDEGAAGQLIEPNPDSVEARALLRIELVRTEVDASGAAVPVVISPAAVRDELLGRFAAFVDLELPSFLDTAAKRGVAKPSQTILDTAMRRYVLKQFRRLDSLDIAAGEVRGDPACDNDATDQERAAFALMTPRRDVDDGIKFAADVLGVPARRFRPGRKPTRSLAERRP